MPGRRGAARGGPSQELLAGDRVVHPLEQVLHRCSSSCDSTTKVASGLQLSVTWSPGCTEAPCLGVLDVERDRAGARVDDVLGRDADVRALAHLAGQAVLLLRPKPHLLWADADRDGAAPAGRGGRARSCRPRASRPSRLRRPSPGGGSDPQEAGDEGGARRLVQLRRRAELLDLARVHDRDRVGHRHRLFLVVRDVDERDADLVLDALQLELHLLAELHVERAERLVEQEHARAIDERAQARPAAAGRPRS